MSIPNSSESLIKLKIYYDYGVLILDMRVGYIILWNLCFAGLSFTCEMAKKFARETLACIKCMQVSDCETSLK